MVPSVNGYGTGELNTISFVMQDIQNNNDTVHLEGRVPVSQHLHVGHSSVINCVYTFTLCKAQ